VGLLAELDLPAATQASGLSGRAGPGKNSSIAFTGAARMRAELQSMADEIEQSAGLLRRHL